MGGWWALVNTWAGAGGVKRKEERGWEERMAWEVGGGVGSRKDEGQALPNIRLAKTRVPQEARFRMYHIGLKS